MKNCIKIFNTTITYIFICFICLLVHYQTNAFYPSDSNGDLYLKMNNEYKSYIDSWDIIDDFQCLEINSTNLKDIYQSGYKTLNMIINKEDGSTIQYNLSRVNILKDDFNVKLSSVRLKYG